MLLSLGTLNCIAVAVEFESEFVALKRKYVCTNCEKNTCLLEWCVLFFGSPLVQDTFFEGFSASSFCICLGKLGLFLEQNDCATSSMCSSSGFEFGRPTCWENNPKNGSDLEFFQNHEHFLVYENGIFFSKSFGKVFADVVDCQPKKRTTLNFTLM